MCDLTAQRYDLDKHRQEFQSATKAVIEQNAVLFQRMHGVAEEERRKATESRQQLMIQISGLVNAQAEAHESRLLEETLVLQKGTLDSNTTLESSIARYGKAIDSWDRKEG